ncbi:MAG: hypothetical protein AAF391_14100, partial [Bacteroidota bacterium]
IFRNEFWPRPLAYFGFATAALLCLNSLTVLDFELGPMTTISVVFLQLWMLTTAIVIIKKGYSRV